MNSFGSFAFIFSHRTSLLLTALHHIVASGILLFFLRRMLCLNAGFTCLLSSGGRTYSHFKPQFQEILAKAQDATKYQLLSERNTCVLLDPDLGGDKCFRNNATPFSALRAVYSAKGVQTGATGSQSENHWHGNALLGAFE